MSARSTSPRSKTTTPALRLVKSRRTARPSTLQILAAFQRIGHLSIPGLGSDLLLQAEAVAPSLVNTPGNILDTLPGIAAALARQTHPATYPKLEAALAAAGEREREAGTVLREYDAEAGFALGLAIGQLLGGGAR